MARWMANLPAAALDKPISTLVIPGSHRSASFEMDVESGVTPDMSQLVRRLSGQQLVHEAIANWNTHQKADFLEQLELGVRFFDLKVAFLDDSIYMVNALRCGLFRDFLSTLAEFTLENPKEVVLVHVQGFFNFTPREYENFLTAVETRLAGRLAPAPHKNLLEITLNRLWAEGHQKEWRQKDFIWPSSLLRVSEKDSEDMDDVLDELAATSMAPKEEDIDSLRVGKRGDAYGHLQVFKAVVFLKVMSAIQRPLGNFEKEFGRQATRKALDWFTQNGRRHRKGLNVILLDFVDEPGLVSALITLNK